MDNNINSRSSETNQIARPQKKWYRKLTGLVLFTVILSSLLYYYRSTHNVQYFFQQAKMYEQQKEYKKALKNYEICIKKYPQSDFLTEAMYRSAVIYKSQFNDRNQAKTIYGELIHKFPDSEWTVRSREEIIACYDYFPLSYGAKWVEGDSQTKGNNFREEITCLGEQIVSGVKMYLLEKKVYAGKKLVFTTREYIIRKDGFYVTREEKNNFENKLIPVSDFKLNFTWKTVSKTGESEYTVISYTNKIRTIAGEFDDCLKIQQVTKNLPNSLRFDYYAPDVGHILTTNATSRNPQEFRISELLSFQKE